MKSKITILLSILFIYFASVPSVQAGCTLYITVYNDFPNVPLNIDKIKTAAYYQGVIPASGLIYKEQWTGNVSIPVGGAHMFTLTVDNACKWGTFDNIWNVRVFRENGTKHTCNNIRTSTSVYLKKPDVCTHN